MIKNKKIILFILLCLLVILGLTTYFIVTLNSRTKTQADDIKSLKNISLNNEKINTEQKDTNSHIKATSVYDDGLYSVYAFNNNMNAIDLNFDGIDDVVIKSHIEGSDYYTAHDVYGWDIYNFYIDRPSLVVGETDYWGIITKEMAGKKIEKFDRDFMTLNMGVPSCNRDETMRIVITGQKNIILAMVKMENGAGFNNYADFELYKLNMTGNIPGSDYIFSYVKTVRSKYASCDLEKFANVDVVTAVREAEF